MRAERLPGLRRLPPLVRPVRRDVVLFNSWWGRLADSPKAIAEELRRRDAPFEHVWVLEDPSSAPEGATVVRPGSLGWLTQSGRARYLVSNNTLPGYFHKKRGQTYLQTWHGAVLKRIGFDIERPSFADSQRYLRRLERESRAWDFLVSPSPFSTEKLRSAFRFQGRILESGYPRNDILFAPDRDAIRARVRAELAIPEAAHAVLYAPTWRDNETFSTELNLAELTAGLGRDHVLLVRSHSAVADTVELPPLPGLRNVSDRDDPGELLLAADVLVTDYSSVMFDFAATGKPLVFYTYDLEHYRDELRGFYFDLTADPPGPVVGTTAELVAALRDVDALRDRFAPAYRRFQERFCALDDGHAAARVVDAVFGDAF